jgi:heterodisulfide reductase subunit B/heterodisulfide reductase subunit C
MEKSIRVVLDRLGLEFTDLDGFTCCPEKSLILNKSEEVWILTAARNLALADASGLDIFSPCNGCVGTLKGAREHLLGNPPLMRKVNERLGVIHRQFTGRARVLHLIELLHDEIGTDVVARHVHNPLKGMRVAVHAGCHQTRPSSEVRVDNPMSPRKLESLVQALGVEVVDYPSKLLCCGGTMNTAGLSDEAREMTRTKLRELSEAEVDVLAVTCPACFMQYDIAQLEMQREGNTYAVPVATLSELMALAFGVSLDGLGLELHRIDLRPVFEKWAGKGQAFETPPGTDVQAMRECVECQACSRDCDVHKLDPTFRPWDIFAKVLTGDLEAALRDPGLFKCVECYTCHELCYQKWGMIHGIRALKHLAIERGLAPEAVEIGVDNFLRTGVLTQPSASRRARLGLPEPSKPGIGELRQLLSSAANEGKGADARGDSLGALPLHPKRKRK